MSDDEQIASKVAPEAVTLRAQPHPVTRLNRRTLAALVGGVSIAVLDATIWSLQPQRRGSSDQPGLYNVDRVAKTQGLDALPTDYSKLPLPPNVHELGPPLPGDLGPAIVNSQQPVIAAYSAPAYDPDDALRKEAEAAAASSVFFRTNNQGQSGTAPASTAAQPTDPTTAQNRQDQKEAFLTGASTQTRNSGHLQMPASPYQVMAGTVIAGALVTGIKSDLPGDDTATGKFLLIPQGSRILGRDICQVSHSQSRVQVVWNRIILPDTSSLTLDNLVGTDPAGYAGLEDDVDWHWKRIFAGAALTTLLGIGAELAAPENRQDGNRVILAGRDSAQDAVNQIDEASHPPQPQHPIHPLPAAPACPCASSSTRIYSFDPTSRFSSTRGLHNDDTQTASRPSTENGIHQTDLHLPGQPQSQPRPIRRPARADLR